MAAHHRGLDRNPIRQARGLDRVRNHIRLDLARGLSRIRLGLDPSPDRIRQDRLRGHRRVPDRIRQGRHPGRPRVPDRIRRPHLLRLRAGGVAAGTWIPSRRP